MELGTLIGLIAGIVFILLAMFITAEWNFGDLGIFADAPSTMVVVGGSLASCFISYKIDKLIIAFKAVGIIFKPPVVNPAASIDQIVTLANTARKEGVLALEESAETMGDQFLKKGVMLIVDGTDPELVEGIMKTELSYIEERHLDTAAIWETIASYAPSWGMIGTMIGLILMLLNLDDPDNLGKMMSVALITTFYGCILANFIANPVASKLKQVSKEELLVKTVLIEGMLSIQAGDNPRIIEEKLRSFLAPKLRESVGAADKRPEAEEE